MYDTNIKLEINYIFHIVIHFFLFPINNTAIVLPVFSLNHLFMLITSFKIGFQILACISKYFKNSHPPLFTNHYTCFSEFLFHFFPLGRKNRVVLLSPFNNKPSIKMNRININYSRRKPISYHEKGVHLRFDR